jgi:hypothetical protein
MAEALSHYIFNLATNRNALPSDILTLISCIPDHNLKLQTAYKFGELAESANNPRWAYVAFKLVADSDRYSTDNEIRRNQPEAMKRMRRIEGDLKTKADELLKNGRTDDAKEIYRLIDAERKHVLEAIDSITQNLQK